MNVKGTAIRSRLDFLRSGDATAGLEATLAALSPEDRRALEVALPTSWIPVELVDRLDLEIVRRSGGLGVAREYGAFSARHNLSCVYRLFVDQAEGDPQALLEGLATLHTSFYDQGSMRALGFEPGRCRIELDFAGQASRFRCQVSLGFVEEALRMLNVSGLQVSEESCQLQGGERCSAVVLFSADSARRAARLADPADRAAPRFLAPS